MSILISSRYGRQDFTSTRSIYTNDLNKSKTITMYIYVKITKHIILYRVHTPVPYNVRGRGIISKTYFCMMERREKT